MLPDFSLPYISLQKLVQHIPLCSVHIQEFNYDKTWSSFFMEALLKLHSCHTFLEKNLRKYLETDKNSKQAALHMLNSDWKYHTSKWKQLYQNVVIEGVKQLNNSKKDMIVLYPETKASHLQE